MNEENIENIEPNQSPELGDLIRNNIDFQRSQNVKRTLFKESLIKISLDKDFKDLFDNNQQDQDSQVSSTANFVEVTPEIKSICSWLEESEEFKGMGFVPYANLPKLFHILHQKVENTVLIVAEYQGHWMQKMEEMARLYKIKWGFINLEQSKEEKIKVLELYEMRKIKLLFVSPGVFKHEEYLQFQSDILIIPDFHLYLKSQSHMDSIVEKCNPGRVLALYSSLIEQSYSNSYPAFVHISPPNLQERTCICLKTTAEDKSKTFLNYLQKNEMKRTLIVVKDKNQALWLSKKLKLASLSSYNMFESLSLQEMTAFSAPDILYRNSGSEEKVIEAVCKSKNFSLTISKYFDALRFAHFDCVVFFNFIDVPKFIEICPDTAHRIALLVDEDYFKLRNEITSELIGHEHLVRIVTKIMEKIKKKQGQTLKRFYSDYVDDNLFDRYSISKQFSQKDEEKVIRMNWFCKNFDINLKTFKRVIGALEKNGVIKVDCKIVYEIEVEEESLLKFRKLFPDAVEIRRRVNLLNLSTTASKTTRALLEELKEAQISLKVTEKALQLKITKNYEEMDWKQLGNVVNQDVNQAAKDLDKSYFLFKECSYGSVQLTRREKSLQRKKDILNFYDFSLDPKSNLFESTHKSNLLTSEIEEWIRHTNQGQLDEHELVLLLQGVELGKVVRFKEDPIFGRYRRVKYEDLSQVVLRTYRNKRVKK